MLICGFHMTQPVATFFLLPFRTRTGQKKTIATRCEHNNGHGSKWKSERKEKKKLEKQMFAKRYYTAHMDGQSSFSNIISERAESQDKSKKLTIKIN